MGRTPRLGSYSVVSSLVVQFLNVTSVSTNKIECIVCMHINATDRSSL